MGIKQKGPTYYFTSIELKERMTKMNEINDKLV